MFDQAMANKTWVFKTQCTSKFNIDGHQLHITLSSQTKYENHAFCRLGENNQIIFTKMWLLITHTSN